MDFITRHGMMHATTQHASDTTNPNLSLTLGEFVQGGYFAGYISHTEDGVATHALVVAPANVGYSSGNIFSQWKTENTDTPGTYSEYLGAENTLFMVAESISNGGTLHPAAMWAYNLNINGYTDWYLPAIKELEIVYVNLKPSLDGNHLSAGPNSFAVPPRTTVYQHTTDPSQTTVEIFQLVIIC